MWLPSTWNAASPGGNVLCMSNTPKVPRAQYTGQNINQPFIIGVNYKLKLDFGWVGLAKTHFNFFLWFFLFFKRTDVAILIDSSQNH
jgi:hypothetical protein